MHELIKKYIDAKDALREATLVISQSDLHWVTCYPYEDDAERDYLNAIGATCVDSMYAISNWDGYGSLWILTPEQNEKYEGWLESQDDDE